MSLCIGCTKSINTADTEQDNTFIKKADEYIETLNNITTLGQINGQVLVAKGGTVLMEKGLFLLY